MGKTELAKAVADIAFGPKPGVRDPYLIRIDCGKLTEARDIVQLVGAPHGLVGYKEGALTNGFRDKGNRCIVLFDEAEKADPKIWQSLLTFFDEGIVTEADGTLYDATGCILVATSNLGYKEATQKFHLFDASAEETERIRPELHEFIWKRVETYFSPEFRGRFGRQNVLFFNSFRREHYRQTEIQVRTTVESMTERGIEVEVKAEALGVLEEMVWEGRQNGATSGGSLRNMCGTALSTLWWQTPISATSNWGFPKKCKCSPLKGTCQTGPSFRRSRSRIAAERPGGASGSCY